jgi:hypothetical protein
MSLTPPLKLEKFLLASLFLFELSITVITMAIYRKGDRPFLVFLSSNPGVMLLVAIAVFFITGSAIIHLYLASGRSSRFSWIVKINVTAMMFVLVTAEIIIRVKSGSSNEGEILLKRVLLPKNWEKVALHHRQLIEQRPGDLSYVVNDDLLGWTIAPNKQSADGMYWSSSEGIRAPHADVTFANLAGKTRIAILGDSFTFGKEVLYEDTWGFLLEQGLGSSFQVLNFGVGGYGVDQAYLRYDKDVRMWKPKIMIYGFMWHAVRRSMMVYPFLSVNFHFPFSKPRYILRDGELEKINVPALAPENIFSNRSIFDLPFLEYDPGYKQSEWHKEIYHSSYLARLFVSIFPSWSAITPDVSDEALLSVNTAILKAFVRLAMKSGAIPIVVYFPEEKELTNANWSFFTALGKRVLHEADIAYTDITPCILELNPTDRFVPSGGHYSAQGNAAVAQCLRTVVNAALDSPDALNSSLRSSSKIKFAP